MNAPTDSKRTKKQKSLEKRLNGYNSRRIVYGKIPHSRVFGTIFPFYYYIFMRQTRNTGRCPVLALTSSSSYMPSIFWLFLVRAGGLFFGIHRPSLFILQVLCAANLIWSGSNTVCLRAADAPASLGGSHRLTGFSILPFEREQPRQGRFSMWRRHMRPPLHWISRTSAGEEVVPRPRTNKGQGSGPS